MPTQYNPTGRPRPHFEIVDWAGLNPKSDKLIPASDQRQLPPQQPAEAAQPSEVATEKAAKLKAALRAIDMQTVEPPSAKEVTGDEIPW